MRARFDPTFVDSPFHSREIRWFFDGGLDEHPALQYWFETSRPFPRCTGVAAPVWRGRLNDAPDIYLMMPGHDDMNVKWREQMLQIKGLVATEGMRDLGQGHRGAIEHWIKWSYADLPAEFESLFTSPPGLRAVAVHKIRGLRIFDLHSSTVTEVDTATRLDRGLGFEITDIRVGDRRYCTLGFEAFPDDQLSDSGFTDTVAAIVAGLRDIELVEARSMSYPAWLRTLD